MEEGLSNSFVNCLIQDRTGFIWFGTDDGLNRFDGYEVKVYRNNPNDKVSISENIIWALWEDHSGNIWIGTKSGGLNKYDPVNDKFKHWELDSASSEEINITCIYEDSNKISGLVLIEMVFTDLIHHKTNLIIGRILQIIQNCYQAILLLQ